MSETNPRRPVPELKQFLSDTPPDEIGRAARDAGTSVAYLHQLAGGHRKASAALSRRLEIVTHRKVCRAHLRPDLFGDLQDEGAVL